MDQSLAQHSHRLLDAIKELNTLQSNSSDCDESRKKDEEYQNNKFEKAKKFAARS